MRRSRGFTVLEVLIVCLIFSLLGVVLWLTLRNVSDLWRKSDSRDDAVRELVKARTSLTRDLRNSSGSLAASARVGPNLGSGYDGDALTFLSSDRGSSAPDWNLASDGKAILPSQVTYFLIVPNVPQEASAGAPDANGYEQQNPYKWLIRRVDPSAGTLNTAWNTWLTRPAGTNLGAGSQIISNKLLGLRVLHGGPLWTLELSAVALKDARHSSALGSIPLQGGPHTLVDRFTVRAQNL